VLPEGATWPAGAEMYSLIASTKTVVELTDRHGKKDIYEFLMGPAAHADPLRPTHVDVFLSHSVKDRDVARELKQDIESAHPGCKVFIAEFDIEPGALWSEGIRRAIRETKCALVMLTPHSVASGWVMAEAGAFWALGTPWIPAVSYADDQKVPEFIRDRQTVDIRTREGRAMCVAAVLRLVRQ
jgi:hypothetical protein